MAETLEFTTLEVSKADWDNLVAHRDNLESILKVAQDNNTHLSKRIDETTAINRELVQRLKDIENVFGVAAMKSRIDELERRIEGMSFDTKTDFVESVIQNYMADSFKLSDHLDNVYDWSRYIDYVSEDDLETKIRDVVRGLEFTVEVN